MSSIRSLTRRRTIAVTVAALMSRDVACHVAWGHPEERESFVVFEVNGTATIDGLTAKLQSPVTDDALVEVSVDSHLIAISRTDKIRIDGPRRARFDKIIDGAIRHESTSDTWLALGILYDIFTGKSASRIVNSYDTARTALPSPWVVALDTNGPKCSKDGKVEISVPDDAQQKWLSIRDKTSGLISSAYTGQSDTIDWPNDLPVADGHEYEVHIDGVPLQMTWQLHTLNYDLTDNGLLASWFLEKGCVDQLISLGANINDSIVAVPSTP
jgi:hypothetical protein